MASHAPQNSEEQHDRFSRFRLINWWEQERLRQAKVLVAGAGALGNEILKNLALLGVGKILIVDLDDVENSNLSRSVLFREKDEGKSKAEAAAGALREIYPDSSVRWIKGDIIHDLGLGIFEWADLVIAGLDNREARLAINRSCWRTGRPWIDGAIEQLSGVARVFVPPGGACYECTMGETDWELIAQRKSCAGLTREQMLTGRTPTTPTAASIIAAVQCQEAVKLLHGLEVLASRGFVFNGINCGSYLIEYVRKEDCFAHETFNEIHRHQGRVSTVTVRALLAEARQELGAAATIELNRDIVRRLVCPDCSRCDQVYRAPGKISEREGACPDCGTERRVDTFHAIFGDEDFLDKTFAEIGVPPFDIVLAQNGIETLPFLFAGDAAQVLGPLYDGSRDSRSRP